MSTEYDCAETAGTTDSAHNESTRNTQLPRDDPDYSASPYDDVWRTIVQTLQRSVILLLNRLFGTHFEGTEQLEPGATEMMLLQLDGSRVRRGVDSHFAVTDRDGNRYVFHVECQTNPDGSIVLRFAEYDMQIAVDSGKTDAEGARDLYLPQSAVINLRGSGKAAPRIIRIHDGEQVLEHEIRVQNMSDLTVDSLLEPDGLALLPYYIFVHREDLRSLAEDPTGAQLLIEEFGEICERLERMGASEELTTYERGVLLELLRKVTRNAVPLGSVSDEVAEMANGSILKLKTVEIFEQGLGQGMEQGMVQGERNTILRLVREGIINAATGARELRMDEAAFREVYRETYPEEPAQ